MNEILNQPKFIWLLPFHESEMIRRAEKGAVKYGGPTQEELGVSLEKVQKPRHQHQCYPCVFFDPIRTECNAGFFTKNLDIHNGCWNSGKVWVKTK